MNTENTSAFARPFPQTPQKEAPQKEDSQKEAVRRWVMLAVAALALIGIPSIIIVAGRVFSIFSRKSLTIAFHNALVAHVDLSVLVWFLTMFAAAISWMLACAHPHRPRVPYMQTAAQVCFAVGMFLIAIAAISSEPVGVMSNYIPVIKNMRFYLGIGAVTAGAVLVVLWGMIEGRGVFTIAMQKIRERQIIGVVWLCLLSGLPILAASLAGFVASVSFIGQRLHGDSFYETAFWGGGHILQFAYMQVLAAVWFLMAGVLGLRLGSARGWAVASAIPVGAVAVCAYPYIAFDVTDYQFGSFFTQHMKWLGGVPAGWLAVVVMVALCRCKNLDRLTLVSLLASLALMIFGGVFGLAITGETVRVPAHYHGMIISVTVALMWLAYQLLQHISGRNLSRWATVQIVVYAVGQLMHISGLALSGGYGVLRKTPGGFEGLEPMAQFGIRIMGYGGGCAILGGVLFIVLSWKMMKR